MFEADSRYAQVGEGVYLAPDGREIPYKLRRFLPPPDRLPLLTTVDVVDGDRLDLIAARNLGRANQGWRVADANAALDPRELLAPGRTLRVPVPQA